ncbi:MAG: prolyl oligopeptidase family serine peptidase, partial [Actinomycetota bacterium]|nr:prolyl oligopeptidase family serine peptidase [Actinomycetota bacterium]
MRDDQPDPYLWLEEVTGDDALEWARRHSEPTLAELSGERFDRMRAEALEILDTDARIPYVRRRGEYLYNYWRDAEHPRGLWRRTTLDAYRGDDPDWDVVIDLDAVAEADGEKWVWAGAEVIEPDFSLALVELSRGGSDATVVREFDMATRQFVTDGFEVPEAKTSISWEDHDTVLVGTDFGPDSLTESGYPRIVKRWRRGEPLTAARTVFEGVASDVSVGAGFDPTPGFERLIASRSIDFFNRERFEIRGEELIPIDVPTDAGISIHREWLLIRPRTDWTVAGTTHPAGSLLAARYDDFLVGTVELEVVFTPDAHTSLDTFAWTRDRLILSTLVDVATKVELVTPGSWRREPITGIPANATTVIVDVDENGDEMFLDSSGFESPSRLLWGHAGGEVTEIKSAPAFFDASDIEVNQHFVASTDGTMIPYFVVGHRDSTGPRKTLLGGYGGFESSNTPGYGGVLGLLWLSRGGTYVLANIRGGGEFGPAWHEAGLKTRRQIIYDDFAAVAHDLVSRGVTSTHRLGIMGGSNGGLLMGVQFTQHPELWHAVIIDVPLLDMIRISKIAAGASWEGEYGRIDDPAVRAFWEKTSPYQNLRRGAAYPEPFIFTTTKDDRVGPQHARK